MCSARPAHLFDLLPAPLSEPPQIDTPSQVVSADETTTVKSPVRDTPSQVVTADETTTVESPVRDVPKSVERRYPTRDRRPPVYYKDCNESCSVTLSVERKYSTRDRRPTVYYIDCKAM